MSFRRKLLSFILIIAVCVNFIPLSGLTTAVQAGSDTWQKDTHNPLLHDNLISGDASVIYDSQAHLYKMWYTQSNGLVDGFYDVFNSFLLDSGPLLKRIQSNDFTTPITSNSTYGNEIGAFRSLLSVSANLTNSDIAVLMQNFRPSIAYATSPDGVNWTYDHNSLHLFSGSGTWAAGGVSDPSVYISSNGTYNMWYTGKIVNPAPVKQLFTDLYAVINPLSDTQIQKLLTDFIINKNIASFLSDLSSFTGSSTLYNILQKDLTPAIAGAKSQIGYASSTDGLIWTPSSTPCDIEDPVVGFMTNWDQYGAASPSVSWNGTAYEMWYTGTNFNFASFYTAIKSGSPSASDIENGLASSIKMSIGKATSPDGINWTRESQYSFTGNPAGLSFLHEVTSPSVISNGNGSYDMWYTDISIPMSTMVRSIISGDVPGAITSITTSICHASSIDNGITWFPDNAPVLTAGSTWDNLGVMSPCVLNINGIKNMWYTGFHADVASIWNYALENLAISEAMINAQTQVAIGRAYLGANTGTVTVTHSGNGSVTGNGTYISGATVTLNATADTGWTFSGWNSTDIYIASSTNSTLNFTMPANISNVTVNANFTQNTYMLYIIPNGSGSVDRNNNGPYHLNDVVQLTAVPSNGWSFDGWSGDLTSTAISANVTITGTMNINANFSQIMHTLTVNKVGNGTITPAAGTHSYASGTVVSLNATADTGWTFSGWSGNVDNSGNSVTMTADKTVTATFTQNSYTLTFGMASGSGTGSVTATVNSLPVDSGASLPYGTIVNLTATADPNSDFGSWTGADSSSGTSANVTMTSDKTVRATFTMKPRHTLTFSTSGTGTGTVTANVSGSLVSSGDSLPYGTVVILTATASGNSAFGSWSGVDSSSGNTATVTMTADKAVTATFNVTTITVNVNVTFQDAKIVGITVPIEVWVHSHGADFASTPLYHTTLNTTVSSTHQGSVQVQVLPGNYDIRAKDLGSLIRKQNVVVGTSGPVVVPMGTLIEGDVNPNISTYSNFGDYGVDILDITYIVSYFNKPVTDVASAECDINGDGGVDILDITFAVANFGKAGDQ